MYLSSEHAWQDAAASVRFEFDSTRCESLTRIPRRAFEARESTDHADALRDALRVCTAGRIALREGRNACVRGSDRCRYHGPAGLERRPRIMHDRAPNVHHQTLEVADVVNAEKRRPQHLIGHKQVPQVAENPPAQARQSQDSSMGPWSSVWRAFRIRSGPVEVNA